jgi:hypothetical protein
MFKIDENPTYKWPVNVYVPRDGGKFVKATFTAEFKALPQDQIDAVLQSIRDGDPDANFAGECLVGWSGVQDSDGTDLPYSDEAKTKLLNMSYVRNAVVTDFFESISGGAARRKNLQR